MEKLGIEPSLLVTQIVNFTIMVFILGKFLYKPILKSLNERQKKIEQGLEFTDKAKQEIERIEERRQEVLNQAKKEAKAIIEDAKKDGRKLKEEILSDGKNEVAQLKQRLEKEMKGREEEVLAEMTSHTVEIAAEIVKRLIPEVMKDKGSHQLIVKQLERIEKIHEKR